jgi:hypothetical protein
MSKERWQVSRGFVFDHSFSLILKQELLSQRSDSGEFDSTTRCLETQLNTPRFLLSFLCEGLGRAKG